MEKYFVPSEKAVAFEKMKQWNDQRRTLGKTEGFVASSLMRRDGQAKGHGMGSVNPNEPTYVATYVFEDSQSMEKWLASSQASTQSELWDKTPERVFYEGTLVISSEEGA